MKKHSTFFTIGLIILMVGCLTIVSCSEKKPRKSALDQQADGSVSGQTLEEEAAEAQRIREEELAAQRRARAGGHRG